MLNRLHPHHLNKTRNSLALVCYLLVAGCGGSSSDSKDVTSISDNVDQPESDSVVLQPTMRTLSIDNVGKITFNEKDTENSPVASISTKDDPEVEKDFRYASSDLEIEAGTNYELNVSITQLPKAAVEVELNVPQPLLNAINSENTIVVYAHTPAEMEPATFVPLPESDLSIKEKLVRVTLPPNLFFETEQGLFEAILKIGLVEAYEAQEPSAIPQSTVAAFALQIPSEGPITSLEPAIKILCPVSEANGGCVEVSRFGTRYVIDATGTLKTRPHRGSDYRGNAINVLAPHSGTVYQANSNEWGLLKIKSGAFSIKFLHLDSINVMEGDTVSEGDIVGVAGGRGESGRNEYAPHIHLEVLSPTTPACKRTPTFPNCKRLYVKNYVDPFLLTATDLRLIRPSGPSEIEVGEEFEARLQASDKQGTPVTSRINNLYKGGSGIIGSYRPVEWNVLSENNSVTFSPLEETTTQPLNLPDAGKNPELRDVAKITLSDEEPATLEARWEGMSESAILEINSEVRALKVASVSTDIKMYDHSTNRIVSHTYPVGDGEGGWTTGTQNYTDVWFPRVFASEYDDLSWLGDNAGYDKLPYSITVCSVDGKWISKSVSESGSSSEYRTVIGSMQANVAFTINTSGTVSLSYSNSVSGKSNRTNNTISSISYGGSLGLAIDLNTGAFTYQGEYSNNIDYTDRPSNNRSIIFESLTDTLTNDEFTQAISVQEFAIGKNENVPEYCY